MKCCLCDISALRFYRGAHVERSDLLSRPRTSRLNECSVANEREAIALLDRFSLGDPPLHVLVDSKRWTRSTKTKPHVHTFPFPPRSFICVSDELFVSSPELLAAQLAARYGSFPSIPIFYELFGMYSLNPNGFETRDVSLATRESTLKLLARANMLRGRSAALELARVVQNGSHSPMETAMSALLTLPRKFGGIGLPPGVLNRMVNTAEGTKYIDLSWPEYGIGLEYYGREYHAGEQRIDADDRRANALLASGESIFIVKYEDLRDPARFQTLVRNVAHALGKRVRIRMKDFAVRQARLRAVVLPAVRRIP